MVAFDHMRIKLSYFDWAYKMLDIYKRLFNNDDVATEDNPSGSVKKLQTAVGKQKPQ
jgi:hypothetical protein